MQVNSIAECSKGSILQYFRPALGYHLSLRSLSIFEWPFYKVLLYASNILKARFNFLVETMDMLMKTLYEDLLQELGLLFCEKPLYGEP